MKLLYLVQCQFVEFGTMSVCSIWYNVSLLNMCSIWYNWHLIEYVLYVLYLVKYVLYLVQLALHME